MIFSRKTKDNSGVYLGKAADHTSDREGVASDGLSSVASHDSTNSSRLRSMFKKSAMSKKQDVFKPAVVGQEYVSQKPGSKERGLTALRKHGNVISGTRRNHSNENIHASVAPKDESPSSASSGESYDSQEEYDSEDEEEEYEEHHMHLIKFGQPAESVSKNIGAHISTMMMYCGISSSKTKNFETADEEVHRTFSLLDNESKICRLRASRSSKPNAFQSVIEDEQLGLINSLQTKINKLYELNDAHKVEEEYKYLNSFGSKSLFEKYGVVKDIIGSGAFGTIKVIDSSNLKQEGCNFPNHKTKASFYAVKELTKRTSVKEISRKDLREHFINRIISEFIISSCLDHKNIAKTLDFMVTLPSSDNKVKLKDASPEFKFNQVMECSSGGDLLTYLTSFVGSRRVVSCMSLEEVDCFVKQIGRGLQYMHKHGVAHCDLKLENILVTYMPSQNPNSCKTEILLKLTDFGRSSVFRTKWDTEEQLVSSRSSPVGSEPYMAPEEHFTLADREFHYSLRIIDYWALGIVILVMFSMRRNYIFDQNYQKSCFVWETTALASMATKKKGLLYKDKNFRSYQENRMICTYHSSTKEWSIQRKGSFKSIERLFSPRVVTDSEEDSCEDEESSKYNDGHFNEEKEKYEHIEEEDDLCEIRRWIIYKLLDPEPSTRLTIDQLLRSDWLKYSETCGDVHAAK